MNKVILMGRLTKEPEVRYSQGAEPTAIARYTLAINKRFKREGEAAADFIDCVAFGKIGEFAEKYFKKGQLVSVVGRLQTQNWEDKNGQKRKTTNVVIEEQFFTEGKGQNKTNTNEASGKEEAGEDQGFYPVPEDDENLPF